MDPATFCKQCLPLVRFEHAKAIAALTPEPLVLLFDLCDPAARRLACDAIGPKLVAELLSEWESQNEPRGVCGAATCKPFDVVQRLLLAADYVVPAAVLTSPSGPENISAVVFTDGDCEQLDAETIHLERSTA